VPDATVIDSLSYNEAMELAYFGAKVIHPQTMAPAVGGGIPIWIRNTFAPEKIGTLICAKPTSTLPVKGITSIEKVALINLEGAGIKAADVTRVVLTHAHPDHIWATIADDGSLTFPNATYYVGAVEWDYWMGPDDLGAWPDALRGFAAGARRDLGAVRDRVVLLAQVRQFTRSELMEHLPRFFIRKRLNLCPLMS